MLSPSKYHWINYDEDQLAKAYDTVRAAQRGTELHEFACSAIRLGVKLPKTPKTLNMYVNDAIGFKMIPEQVLYYSENSFGTADAICFRNNKLRVHDLKTGVTPASEKQLMVYVALFSLEYRISPFDFEAELRIYQNDAVQIHMADPVEVTHIREKIIYFDKLIKQYRAEDGA